MFVSLYHYHGIMPMESFPTKVPLIQEQLFPSLA